MFLLYDRFFFRMIFDTVSLSYLNISAENILRSSGRHRVILCYKSTQLSIKFIFNLWRYILEIETFQSVWSQLSYHIMI